MTGVDLEGAMVPGGLPQDETPVMDDFERLYLQRFGTAPNRFAAAGYTAARRVLEVFVADPEADRQRVQEALALRFGGGFDSNAPMPFLVVKEGALKELVTH